MCYRSLFEASHALPSLATLPQRLQNRYSQESGCTALNSARNPAGQDHQLTIFNEAFASVPN